LRQSFYIGVKGIVTTSQGVLILKDAPRGKWELPGGRIDAGQSIEDAFIREINEEVPGTTNPKLERLLFAAQGDFIVENDHKLCLLFYAASADLPETLQLSDEHTDQAFVTADTLSNFDLFSTDKEALERYLSE
jgi:ADP-ribose pyrophosphatase YjhB (NUDIX family)